MKRFVVLMFLGVSTILVACGGSATAGIPSTPDGTVSYISQQLADGHPEILWDALPAGYQSDLLDLTHEFASKMDPQVWDKSFLVLGKLVSLLRDKKDLFFQTNLLDSLGDKKGEIEANWDTAVSVLDKLTKSDLSSLESMQTLDWKKFLSVTGSDLMALAKQASAATEDNAYEHEFLDKVRGMKVEVKKVSGDEATLLISLPDEEEKEIELVHVEDRWIPGDLADDWKEEMEEARKKLEQLTPETMAQQKMQYMMFLGMAEGMIDQLAQAGTPEELEKMLGGILGQLPVSGEEHDRVSEERPSLSDSCEIVRLRCLRRIDISLPALRHPAPGSRFGVFRSG